MDFKNIVITKPWGYEYLIYDNGNVSGWLLYILAGKETSLHAHPKKTTGLILLDGQVRLTFLNDGGEMVGLDKRVIHPHVFHKTHANIDSVLLETETPIDKTDIIRFRDAYGRDGEPYEGESSTRARGQDEGMLSIQKFGMLSVGPTTMMQLSFISGAAFTKWAKTTMRNGWLIALTSGVISTPKGVHVIIPGHVVWSHNLKDLMNTCEANGAIDLICLWHKDSAGI